MILDDSVSIDFETGLLHPLMVSSLSCDGSVESALSPFARDLPFVSSALSAVGLAHRGRYALGCSVWSDQRVAV